MGDKNESKNRRKKKKKRRKSTPTTRSVCVCATATLSKKRKINKFPLTVPHNLQKLKVVKLLYLCRCKLLYSCCRCLKCSDMWVCEREFRRSSASFVHIFRPFGADRKSCVCDKYIHAKRRCQRRKPLRTI